MSALIDGQCIKEATFYSLLSVRLTQYCEIGEAYAQPYPLVLRACASYLRWWSTKYNTSLTIRYGCALVATILAFTGSLFLNATGRGDTP